MQPYHDNEKQVTISLPQEQPDADTTPRPSKLRKLLLPTALLALAIVSLMDYQSISDIASSEQQRDGSGSLFARSKSTKRNFALVIHGGAGAITREESTEEQRTAYKRALGVALKAGHAVLEEGGEAMDAAVAAVMQLESK